METDKGVVYNQSNAILHYIGSKTGLYSDNLEERYWADWGIETFNDLWSNGYYQVFFADAAPTEEKEKETIEKAAKFSGLLAKRLAHNDEKHFFGGDHMSIGDVKCFAAYCSIAFNDGVKHPKISEAIRHQVTSDAHLNAWFERMNTHFADYLKARPAPRPM